MRSDPAGTSEPRRAIVLTVSGDPATAVGQWLADGSSSIGDLRPLVAPLPGLAYEIEGPAQAVMTELAADLPTGAAAVEAAAIVLRRSGVEVITRAGHRAITSRRELVRALHAYGRDSVAAIRGRPELLTEMRIGSWFSAGWVRRAKRRIALLLRIPPSILPPSMAADVAFWSGVRRAATSSEWRRLAGSSYVCLCYHRIAGLTLPGQERMDVSPRAVRWHLRMLRLLGWRALAPEQLMAFHDGTLPALPRRRYVVTADDGLKDAVAHLSGHPKVHPQLFPVTAEAGGTASWLGEAPLASWAELRRAEATGLAVGSHARRHQRLDELARADVADQLAGSREDLAARLASPIPVLAYPHGAHDHAVRDAARSAGFRIAWTTKQGRNGAGTDPWCLRRIEPKAWDSAGSILWKVVTGESVPKRWEWRQLRRFKRRYPSAFQGGASS